MKGDGSDEILVLKDAEALLSAEMPELDRLVHGGREQKVVFAPAEGENLSSVAGEFANGFAAEDGGAEALALGAALLVIFLFLLVLVCSALFGSGENGVDADNLIHACDGEVASVKTKLGSPNGIATSEDLAANNGGGDMLGVGVVGVFAGAGEFLCEKEMVKGASLFVVGLDADVSRGFLVQRQVAAAGAHDGGHGTGIGAIGAGGVAKFGVGVVTVVIFSKGASYGKATEKGGAFFAVLDAIRPGAGLGVVARAGDCVGGRTVWSAGVEEALSNGWFVCVACAQVYLLMMSAQGIGCVGACAWAAWAGIKHTVLRGSRPVWP